MKKRSFVCICTCVVIAVMNAFAYLPSYDINCYVTKSESFREKSRNSGRGIGGWKKGGVFSFSPWGCMTINGEDCRVGAEGPIRFYYTHLMPHVPGEPLFSTFEEASISWIDKNMPMNIPGLIRKPTTAHDRVVADIQKVFIEKLKEYREDIGKLYNESMKFGADTSELSTLCVEWRQIANSKDWKLMKDRGKGLDAMDRLQKLLMPYGSFDKKIWNAYGPVIDGKLAQYENYKKKLPPSKVADEEMAKLKRIAASAKRQADAACQEAAFAQIRAKEAEQRASSAAADAWAAQQEANRARRDANATRMDAEAARFGW